MTITVSNTVNHTVADVVVNGDFSKMIAFPPGSTASVQGTEILPGIIPVWMWNKFKSQPIGVNAIKAEKLTVVGDSDVDEMMAEEKKKAAAEEKAKRDAEKQAAKAARESEKEAAKTDAQTE